MAITRDAFVYMDPKSPADTFAQCGTCVMWTGKTCTILGPGFPVKAGDSCNLYVHGKPSRESRGEEEPLVSPQEVGFVRREVRCENCISYKPLPSLCKLFETLNEKVPSLFDLDPNVHPKGCCNAQQPKSYFNK